MGWGSVLGGSATEKEPLCPPVFRRAILKAVRTSHARAVRRIHGDRGGIAASQIANTSHPLTAALTLLLESRKIISH